MDSYNIIMGSINQLDSTEFFGGRGGGAGGGNNTARC